MTPGARAAAAIDLLTAIEASPHRPADGIANDFFRARRYIGSGDRRAVAGRVWTVLRRRRRLGWLLADAPPTPRLLVACSLLAEGWSSAGLVQLFSGGPYAPPALVPAEAAVLRARQGCTIDAPEMPEAVRLEVPDWLLPRLQAVFPGTCAAELAALLQEAPLDLRVNLLKSSREQAQAALAAEGIAAAPTPYSPWGLRIAGRRPLVTGAAFRAGLVDIQDEGSQIIAALTDAAPGMRVVDYCAGAGGKTLALAMVMENRGRIVACDTSAARLEGAVRRLRRAGVHNVERHVIAAGDKWAKRHAGGFDRVLVDAPCTGTGTWRRRPDARRHLAPDELAALLTRQAGILDASARLVRIGGRLVYATCSLLAEENEAQVSAFLDRHDAFAALAPARAWSPAERLAPTGPWLRLTPHAHGTDGFFAAVLERTR
ncbi:MAG: RsmB/NOP family class I SAM-dependent RNA methyltransferase [Acidisphaera sp.]|nr:RsmB/NOP family class I SAM-dependent RNA methyltransferase [Acidisphaera sp.]